MDQHSGNEGEEKWRDSGIMQELTQHQKAGERTLQFREDLQKGKFFFREGTLKLTCWQKERATERESLKRYKPGGETRELESETLFPRWRRRGW